MKKTLYSNDRPVESTLTAWAVLALLLVLAVLTLGGCL